MAYTAGQAYCARCGWNRHVAALQIRSLQRLLPIFLLPLLAFGFLMVSREDSWLPFLYVVIVGAVLCVAGVLSLSRSLDKLERIEPIGAEQVRLSAMADPSEEEEARARALVGLARPRPVHLSSSGRVYMVGVALVGTLFELLLLWHLMPLLAGSGWAAMRSVEAWFMLTGVLFFPAAVAIVAYGLARQRRLVAHGDAALARVTRQWKVRGNSWIRYEFSVGGATIVKEAIDVSHRLYAGMTVPVFYDATDLRRQVACCAAYYQIVLPGMQ